MKTHWDYSDDDFLHQFADCTFPAELFSHEAHLRYAWIHLHRSGEEEAVNIVSDSILKYVSHIGARDKYHMTLTVAAVKVVHHFSQKSDSVDFKGFTKEFPQLKSNFKELVQSHYSFDVFQSERAKREYLEPDL